MTVEDIIKNFIKHNVSFNRYDSSLFSSLYNQISLKNSGFTEKQASLILKILPRYANQYQKLTGVDIHPFLVNPTFMFPVRKSSNLKKISICDHEDYQRALKMEFPYDEKIIEEVKKYKFTKNVKAHYNGQEKVWYFALSEESIGFLTDFVIKFNFEIDEEFENYLAQQKNILENLEQYVPLLKKSGTSYNIENLDYKFPEKTFTTPLAAIFYARKLGVQTWDEEIEQYLIKENIDKLTLNFIKSDPSEKFTVSGEEHDFYDFKHIINYLFPCLIIIPGGSELENVTFVYNFLQQIGIKNKEISTMFRLSSDTGKNFNDYVKHNQLNSPISDKTKVVFISSKLPKPIIESEIKFHCLINLGIGGVHYTIREFIANNENIIFFVKNNSQREMNFEYM